MPARQRRTASVTASKNAHSSISLALDVEHLRAAQHRVINGALVEDRFRQPPTLEKGIGRRQPAKTQARMRGPVTLPRVTHEVNQVFVKVGLCGFKIGADTYAKTFPVVEVPQTFYDPPTDARLQIWRDRAPADFEFTMKV